MEMIWCPPGAHVTKGAYDIKQHPVILTMGYYLGKFEVTQSEYKEFMKFNPSEIKSDRLPVSNVSIVDALEFCEKLTTKKEACQENGNSHYPLERSGSMLVVLEPLQTIHGEIVLIQSWPTHQNPDSVKQLKLVPFLESLGIP